MAVRRLAEAYRQAQALLEPEQEAIADELLELLADLDAYHAAKREGGTPIPLDQVLHSIAEMDE
jgi:hypothetical protein